MLLLYRVDEVVVQLLYANWYLASFPGSQEPGDEASWYHAYVRIGIKIGNARLIKRDFPFTVQARDVYHVYAVSKGSSCCVPVHLSWR